MKSMYWDSNEQKELNINPSQEKASSIAIAFGQFSTTCSSRTPVAQPIPFSTGIQLVSDLKTVMKKLAMIAIGITLFIAGYHHIRRQNEYVTAQAALSTTSLATAPAAVPASVKNTIAFRLIKPS